MDTAQERPLLISDYNSLASILRKRGLDFYLILPDDLQTTLLSDLREVVANMRDLARTPS